MGEWRASSKVEWHLRWLVRGASRHGPQRTFNQFNLHLNGGEECQHIGLG